MVTSLPRPETHLRTAARRASVRLSRLATVLAAATCALLASAASIPAAFARVIPPPGGSYGATRIAPVPASARVVTAGGMAGWQVTLIALGAALVAASVTLLLEWTWAARRAASATRALRAPVRRNETSARPTSATACTPSGPYCSTRPAPTLKGC